MVALMTDFVWRDGERMIRFGETRSITCGQTRAARRPQRAETDVPARLRDHAGGNQVRARRRSTRRRGRAGRRGRRRPAGRVGRGTGDRCGQGDRIGSRRQRVRRAHDPLRRRDVARPPHVAGFEDRPRVRPGAGAGRTPADGSAPPELLRASAMNALGHAMEALYVPGRNPVATLAGAAAAELAGGGPRRAGRRRVARAGLDPGRLRAGLGRAVAPPRGLPDDRADVRRPPHAATNAAMLPHTAGGDAGSRRESCAGWRTHWASRSTALPGRIAALGRRRRARSRAGRCQRDALGAVAEAARRAPRARPDRPPPEPRPAACGCSRRRLVG